MNRGTFLLATALAVMPARAQVILSDVQITTRSLPDGRVGVPYSATISLKGGRPLYHWTVSGTLPPGLSLEPITGAIGGTPTDAGTFHFTVRVSDATGSSDTQGLSITIRPAPLQNPLVITASLPAGTVGAQYSAPLTASGGTPPYSWSATGLPPGLSLTADQIGGTPAQAGTFTVSVGATDTAATTVSATYNVVISSGPSVPSLTITTSELPGGKTGSAYSASLAASGGTPPYSWSVASGSLPAGLGVSGSQITGTPSSGGTARFTIQVRDSAGQTASADLTLTVAAAPLAVSGPAQLPGGVVGEGYSYALGAAGGTPPYVWRLTSGAVPPGLTLSGGMISGSPAADGNYQFAAQVTDSAGGSASASFSVTIAPGLSITSTSPLPAAAVGTAYSQAMAALAGKPPYQWSVTAGSLPQGLALDPATGVLSGTPSAGGSFSFTVQVSDSAGTVVSKPFTMTVASALTVTTGSPMPAGSVGASYSQTLAAVAGTSPYTWAVSSGALPAGLALNASTGALSGTPATAGTFNFTVQVRDTLSASASKVLAITISPALAMTTASSLPSGTAGHPYSQQLSATGGLPPYTWAIAGGALPSGLALDGARGSLSGTPQAAGDFQFKLGITDSAGATVSAAAQLHIGLDALPAVAITGLPDSANPLAQPQLGVNIAGKYPIPITGQLVLTFEPDAAVQGDDPAIQFSTGGRTADFTIPANSTQVNLPAQLALQTGSVAGTITVTAVLKAGGVDTSRAPVHTVRIARSAPVIRGVKMVKTATGFEIWITGYSPSRELTRATFRFAPASGGGLLTTTADLPLTDSAQQWYQDANSKLFGSQFTIVQPFTVQGSTDAIGSVFVTLANSVGVSQEAQVQ